MVVSRQLNEVRTRDELGHEAALLYRRDPITMAMEDEGRDSNLLGQIVGRHGMAFEMGEPDA
jgi:hypothetical protein